MVPVGSALLVVGALIGTLLAGAGCSGDSGLPDGGRDGSAADASADAGLAVAAPVIPWLEDGAPPLMVAPCPEGWREVLADAITVCDPYPEAGPATCAPGDAHFSGEDGCRPIGDPCPAGAFASSLPADGVVIYVSASAPPGGDGSETSPFAALSDVPWPSLAAGTTVALGRGTYEGVLALKAGVRVVGACAAETVLTGLAAPVPAVVVVTSTGEPAEVRNVSIRGAPQAGASLLSGDALALRGVLIDGAREFGVFAAGAGAEVELTDVVIENTASATVGGVHGRGIHAQDGARVETARVLVRSNRDIGVFVGLADTAAVLRDTVIRDTEPQALDGIRGRGLQVEGGAHLEATNLLLASNHDVGLLVDNPGTEVQLRSTIVTDTKPRGTDRRFGRGIDLAGGAHLDAERLLVAGNRGLGVFAVGAGTSLKLADAVVRDTEPQASDGSSGRGIAVVEGALFEGARLVVAGNHDIGIWAESEGTRVVVADLVVRDGRPGAVGGFDGRGVEVVRGAFFEGDRVLIGGNGEMGLTAASAGTQVVVRDVVIRDTAPRASDGMLGRALHVQGGARLDGVRLRLERASEVGLMAFSGAEVILEDTSILVVDRAPCPGGTCSEAAVAYGAVAADATLHLTRFEIREAETCGVLVAETASLDLRSGVISGSAIGACVQVDAYDLARLSDDVEYRANGVNLDSTMLPVPNGFAPAP